MVRVMSVYHFASVNICTCREDLVGAVLISENELGFAKTDHSIEIKTLNGQPEEPDQEVRTFSTVDDVEQIIYCANGHYIATLESRISPYEQAEVRYVRVYANWDQLRPSSEKDYISTALRARIAGKITPMHKCLEMIELPLDYNPTLIACCQSTGNLLVANKSTLQLFEFKCCTNENTKNSYIDFFEAPFQLELDFQPDRVLINENFISCSSKLCCCVFKINESNDATNSESTNIFSSSDFHSKSISNINLDEDVDYLEICNKTEVNGYQFDVKMKSSNSNTSFSSATSDDFPQIYEAMVLLKYTNQNFTQPTKYTITKLLQLKLQSREISGIMRENNDSFKCLFARSLYLKKPVLKATENGSFFMHSRFHSHFYGLAFLITTNQDGYLYLFNNVNVREDGDQSKYFLNVYPFTSPVIDVALHETVLHALTENGIESYTVRLGQKMFHDLEEEVAYKNLSKSISLINLRPFLRIHFMLPSDENLILLANDTPTHETSQSTWTVYDLKYPDITTIYNDFKEFADKSLKKYPNVYLNLLEELHLIFRTNLAVTSLNLEKENGSSIRLVNLAVNETKESEIELMKESCLSLADFYITSNTEKEHQLAMCYYNLANFNIIQIFQRFVELNGWIQLQPTGLCYTLKSYFKQLKCDTSKYDEIFSSTIDVVVDNKPKKLKFGDALIELFGTYAPKEIALMALESGDFREYMDEKIYEFLSNFQEKSNEELLCVILHLLKKDEVVAANAILNQINNRKLYELLIKHWNILFEFTKYSTSTNNSSSTSKKHSSNGGIISFSDFTELCFLTNSSSTGNSVKINSFVDVLLFHMYETKSIHFDSILKLFMEYLASQFGHDSYANGQNILKVLLEKYLMRYYDIKNQVDVDLSLLSSSSNNTTNTLSVSSAMSMEHKKDPGESSWNDQEIFQNITSSNSNKHAMKILVRIYLSQLKMLSQKYYVERRKSNQEPKKSSLNKTQLIKLIDEMNSQLFINHRHVNKHDKIANLLMNCNETILFIDERLRYLDWMPPFEDNLMHILNDSADETRNFDFQAMDRDLLITLIKLQALLCSNELATDVIKEIVQFIQGNSNIIGFESILVCIYPLQQSIDLIMKTCPHCILEYGRCHFKMDSDWTYLIKSLQKKVGEIEVCDENLPNILFYHRLLKETLEFLATTKPLEQILKIFPEEKYLINNQVHSICPTKSSNEFENYLRLSIDKDRSEKIKKMIENTGNQLYDAIQNKS